VVTDARPEQIKQIFKKHCLLIGRRFRLAHIRFRGEIVEVATFRVREDGPEDGDRHIAANGRIVRDNIYGRSISEDVWRRDFSVNALYYNIADLSVIDFTDGISDLATGTLRLIGDPETRYREDAVRTLRAVRFAAKLGFRIHPDTEAPIYEFGKLLQEVPPARLFDETLKLLHGGYAVASFHLLRHYGLFGQLFPATDAVLKKKNLRLVEQALANTDNRIAEGKPVTPAFLFAALLWPPLQRLAKRNRERGMKPTPALDAARYAVIEEQVNHVMIPRRFTAMTKEIWGFQSRLVRNFEKRPKQIARHPRFRAAYDFLVLRAETGDEEVRKAAKWWTDFQENHEIIPDKPKKKRPPG